MTTKLKPKTKDWRKYARHMINSNNCKPACFGKTGHVRKEFADVPAYLEAYSMQYWFDIATKRAHA
jgi:hypothetical protein